MNGGENLTFTELRKKYYTYKVDTTLYLNRVPCEIMQFSKQFSRICTNIDILAAHNYCWVLLSALARRSARNIFRWTGQALRNNSPIIIIECWIIMVGQEGGPAEERVNIFNYDHLRRKTLGSCAFII